MTRFTKNYEITKSFNKDMSVVTVGYSNPEVLNYNTYISYDLLNLIGVVGGILGLTLGVSALTLLDSFLQKIPHY